MRIYKHDKEMFWPLLARTKSEEPVPTLILGPLEHVGTSLPLNLWQVCACTTYSCCPLGTGGFMTGNMIYKYL